jgi:heme exporter protein D
MWGAFARQLFAYVLTKRGKRVLGFVGTMLLCFVTALLLDLQLYLTAAFTGFLTLLALFAWLTQNVRQRRRERVLARQEAEELQRRAQAAAARAETVSRARSSVAGAARSVTNGAYGVAKSSLYFWRWRRTAGSRSEPAPEAPTGARAQAKEKA